MHGRNVSTLVFLLLVLALAASAAYAQRLDGSLRGTLKDATGGVLPGVTVSAVNEATGVSAQRITSDVGMYFFPNLLVGKYSVTMELAGFKKTTLSHVEVFANQVAEANATLDVGDVTAEVAVAAGGEIISTTTSQVGGSLADRQVIDLPISVLGGSVLNLAVLFPNTTTQGGGVLGEGGSIGGNRPRNNNFTIDGVDNNDISVTGALSPVIQDAVEEFNLLTNQFSAESGHSSAGQFNVITKSGGNEFHGRSFFYGQNRKLNAVDNLVEQAIRSGDLAGKPRYDFARAGGTLGGPIKKDKLFFFGAYEYQTRGRAATGVTVLAPTSAGLATLNSLAANDRVRELLAQLPAASSASRSVTVNGQAIPVGNVQAFAPDYYNRNDFQTNMDANLGLHQVRGRFLYDRYRAPNVNTELPLPQFTGTINVDNRKVILTDVWTMTSQLVQDARVSYSRNVQAFLVPDRFKNFPNVGIDDLGLSYGPDGNSPQSGTQNTYQLVENLSYSSGRHQWKGGIEYRNWIAPSSFLPRSRGEWDYANLGQLVNDLVPAGLNSALRGAGVSVFAGNQQAVYSYFQDDLKLGSKLTLNLGLRHEWTSVPRDAAYQGLNAIASAPGLFDFRKPKSDRNNFAPRFGFAYSPGFSGGPLKTIFGESGRSSVRGGFGVAYDVTFQNLILLQLPPQLQTEQNPELTCAGASSPSWCGAGAGFLAGGGLLQVNVPPATQAEARSATQALIVDQPWM